MNNWINLAKWNLDKIYNELTIYKILIFSVLLWAMGIWIWIIPQYVENTKKIKLENGEIQEVLKFVNHDKRIKNENLFISSDEFNYNNILMLTLNHQIKLESYNLQNTLGDKSKYQIKVSGSWFDVRVFLSDFNNRFNTKMTIDSLEFQRDQQTNNLSLTMQVFSGAKN